MAYNESDNEPRVLRCTVASRIRRSGAQGFSLLLISATRNDVASLGRPGSGIEEVKLVDPL